MSINVGSNFLYQGKNFLDDRIGKIKTIQELTSWNIPIPDGFEVYVEGNWFTYDSSNSIDPIYGKFRKRLDISQEFGNAEDLSISQVTITNKFDEVDESIKNLTKVLFPLEFKSITSNQTVEVGSTIRPKISWSIHIKGKEDEGELQPNNALVNSSLEGVSPDFKSWESPKFEKMDEPGKKTYLVEVEYDKQIISKEVQYNFYYKKYYGVSSEADLKPADVLKLTNAWASSYKLSETKFNCSGGKYPYYIIPKVIYNQNTSLSLWIGGFKNTDLIIKEMELPIATGLVVPYVVIRLNNIQTGSDIYIEVK